MHDERRRIEERVERILQQRIQPAVHAAALPLDVTAWEAPDEPVPFAEAASQTYEPFAMGTPWGPPWGTTWFRVRGEVPAAWAGRRVEAVFDLGFVGDWPGNQAEALVHTLDGSPLKAVNPQNQYVPVAPPAAGGERIDYLVEAASNPDILADGFAARPRSATRPRRAASRSTPSPAPTSPYSTRRSGTSSLDMQVLRELMLELGEHEPRRHEIMHALDHALDALDLDDISGTAADVRELLRPVLTRPAHASAHTMSAVGHAHIDTAWLWPIRETKRKTSRTFSNVTALAQEYEEFVFACSQAQQYAWVRDNYPQVWERIKKAVADGQWAPVGGMWVESDGNLPGGEALARQFVHGKRFFIEHFGIETQGRLAAGLLRLQRGLPAAGASWRATSGSSPRSCPGTRPTSCPTTPSGGRASTARGSSRTSRRWTRTTRSSPAARWRTRSATTRTRAAVPARWRRSGTATAVAAPPAR